MARTRIINPRQIRYNLSTDSSAQTLWRHSWTFFILNAKRECDRIQEKLLQEMAPCDNMVELDSGILVPTGSLIGRLMTLDTNCGRLIHPNKVYASDKWHCDRDLRPMNDIELEEYASRYRSSD